MQVRRREQHPTPVYAVMKVKKLMGFNYRRIVWTTADFPLPPAPIRRHERGCKPSFLDFVVAVTCATPIRKETATHLQGLYDTRCHFALLKLHHRRRVIKFRALVRSSGFCLPSM